MKIIYIAGPYTADTPWETEQNVREAEAAAYEIWKEGHAAICPHTNTRWAFGDRYVDHMYDGTLEIMFRCDAVLMVGNWGRSLGAVDERREAERRGLPVFESFEKLVTYLEEEEV